MSSMNVCILLGRLKDDPNVRKHSSGVEIATMILEEIVVQRDRVSGNPVERAIHHEVRVYNPAFVQTAKAEGARGRHVEVHGQLAYGDDGKAYVAVPSQGGRVAFKYFEVREVPSEPPVVVADHEAARDLASAIPDAHPPEAEMPVPQPEPEAASQPAIEAHVEPTSETVAPVEEAEQPAHTPEAAVESRPAPAQTPPRPGFAARPPQIGGGFRPAPASVARPGPGPSVVQSPQAEDRGPAPERTPPASANPPPVRPSVGSSPVRAVGTAPIAGVVQPRPASGPRIGGPVTRPTTALRPAPAHPTPVAAVAGRPASMPGGGLGRVGSSAANPRGNAWRGGMDDLDDVPF